MSSATSTPRPIENGRQLPDFGGHMLNGGDENGLDDGDDMLMMQHDDHQQQAVNRLHLVIVYD